MSKEYLDKAGLTYLWSKLKAYIKKDYDKTVSRGEQLVVNGSGMMGDNTNFSSWTFDGSMSNGSPGSFTRSAGDVSALWTNDFFPVTPSLRYRLSVDFISKLGVGRMYTFPSFYDVDKYEITASHHMYRPNTLTTLSQDLKTGDTVVHFTDLSGWDVNTSTRTYQRGFIFWNYTNTFGYTYPENTYSRNTYANLYEDSNVNKTNHTITLSAPWSRGTYPAGTKVSQCDSGATFKYIATSNTLIPTTWASYQGIIGGIDYSGTNASGMFPPGTAYSKIGFLWNYSGTGNGDQIWTTNVSFQEIPIASDSVDYGGVDIGLGANTPATNAKEYYLNENKVPTSRVKVFYNTSGSEYTSLFSKGSGNGNYGSILKWGYPDKYLRILRRGNGTWYTTDWEKIDAGYSDRAGQADKAGDVNGSCFLYPMSNNEINFGGSASKPTLFFGYRTMDNQTAPSKYVFSGSTGTASLQCDKVYLGSGTNSYVSSSSYTGKAATSGNADTVNSHTVNSDVPANAKFTDTVTTAMTTGSGNAVTAISASNGALTVTKGTTFLTSHQDISGKADKATTLAGYGITDAKIASGTITLGSNTITPLTSHQDISGKADKSATVSTVTWDSTNKKFTKTINGTTTDIVTAANLRTGLNVADGAEVNQDAFSNVTVGSTTIAADSKTDTLTLTAGSNVTLTPDATNDKITIAATDTTYESKAAASGGTAVSLVTTGEKYTWNNKSTVPTNHASSATTYGTGTSSNYGHLKLSDSTSSNSGTSGGIAATPSAVKSVYDLANTANGTANTALSGVNGNLIYDHTFSISNGVATFTPHVYQKGAEVTTNYAASCFTWKYRLIDGSEVTLTTKSNRGCDVTISTMGYGGHVIGSFTPPAS